MNVGELFVRLGFKVNDSNLKSFDRGINNLTSNIAVMATALTAAAYVAERMITAATAGGTALHNFAIQTGLSSDELQKWQAAATQANPALGVEQVTSSIMALNQALVDIRMGGGDVSPFTILGINPLEMKDAFQVLERLRDKVDTVNRPLFTSLLGRMGLDPGFINALQLSREEFDALTVGLVRAGGAAEGLNDLNSQLAKLGLQFAVIRDNAVVEFIPAIEKAIDIIGTLTQTISMALKEGMELGEEFPKTAAAIAAGIGLILFPLNSWRFAILAIVAALADLNAYRNGGDSLIGDAKSHFDRFLSSFTGDKISPIDPPPGARNQTVNNNKNVSIEMNLYNPSPEFEAEKLRKELYKALDQSDLNHSFNDQQYKGARY